MPTPDSNQKALAGEFYVSYLLNRMGYAVALTIGNAKSIDVVASSETARAVNFQVKTTLKGYDWLVRRHFADRTDLLIALVRLGTARGSRPELYVLRPGEANRMIILKYKAHSPRIRRSKVRALRQDHDLSLDSKKLGE
jgi:hypothetical protein